MICSHRAKQVTNGARWSPAQSHLAGLADRMKLLGLWCFSHRMRVAISPGLRFLWTVVLRKSESCLRVRWEPFEPDGTTHLVNGGESATMRLLLLGATGLVGRTALNQALAKDAS